MKHVILVMYLLATRLAYADINVEIATYLHDQLQSPEDYVLSKAISHKITIIGEAHWLKQDVSFVAALIPALKHATIDLAVEVFPASQQAEIDELITAPKWSNAGANAVMHAAGWPYQEYRGLLRNAWSVNRNSAQRINILALGPPADWRRSLLPKGKTYDSFMADLVIRHTEQKGRSVVVYTGMHHAFTRYYQAELSRTGTATAYMDRMGNILMRSLGEQVFLIALHKPIWCGSPTEPSYCLPFAGQIDCAASQVGRSIGFDVVDSPLAELRFEPADYYAYAHKALRFVDYTDGYIWLGAIDTFRPVTIIELDEFAPNATSLRAVMKSNPFTGESNVTKDRLQEIWAEQIETNQNLLAKRKWTHLSGTGCVDLEDSNPP
jgi:hypothetical protein